MQVYVVCIKVISYIGFNVLFCFRYKIYSKMYSCFFISCKQRILDLLSIYIYFYIQVFLFIFFVSSWSFC